MGRGRGKGRGSGEEREDQYGGGFGSQDREEHFSAGRGGKSGGGGMTGGGEAGQPAGDPFLLCVPTTGLLA